LENNNYIFFRLALYSSSTALAGPKIGNGDIHRLPASSTSSTVPVKEVKDRPPPRTCSPHLEHDGGWVLGPPR